MDLAYGDCHPSALARHQPPEIQDNELKGLVNRAEWLLDEANCMHHTATATIAHLQKNPDAMAAVALTLAEISNLATKMAPAALSALKTAAPAVWALLASPQFLIAAGVGLGVTVVMFGGYKIVKRIKSGNINSPNAEAGWQGERPRGHSPSMEEMMELNTECLSHVEKWRRGVADAEAESVGTSVEGEFITPTAAAMSRLDVTSARGGGSRSRYGDEDASVATTRRSRRSRAHHRSSARASSVDANSRLKSKPKSESGARSKRGDGSKAESRSDTGKGKRKEKEKKGPSRLRQMFMP